MRLRRLADGVEITVRAFGRFATHQTALGVRARLAYIFGREPELLDLASAHPGSRGPAPAFGVPRRSAPPRPAVKDRRRGSSSSHRT